ncbi:MAG TPA: transcriptional regulator [Verrucomicrobiae bacterium]|nr:transcriptional regulator [Verrucomicrobiae bacterium]
MKKDNESISKEFLELASEQRVDILLKLYEGNSKVAILAKEFGATVPEVFRNFDRMVKANLITKNPDGDYSITTYGKIVCEHIPSIRFMTSNKKYFQDHSFGDIPSKFLQRIGALEDGKQIKGFVKLMEYWKEIYKNADKYILNVLYEVPFNMELVEPLVKKLQSGVKLSSILSESAIMSKDRKDVHHKLGLKKLIEQGLIERKMLPNVSVVVILNEKQACVIFPNKNGEVDLSDGFYGETPKFQEWCHDYFDYCWSSKASPFQESKLKNGD